MRTVPVRAPATHFAFIAIASPSIMVEGPILACATGKRHGHP
jgi:hypothetical protein